MGGHPLKFHCVWVVIPTNRLKVGGHSLEVDCVCHGPSSVMELCVDGHSHQYDEVSVVYAP